MPLEFNSPKLKYIAAFANKHYPDFDFDEETGEYIPYPSQLIDFVERKYDKIISNLPPQCTEEEYKNNTILQSCIEYLKLDSDALWVFITALYYFIDLFADIQGNNNQTSDKKNNTHLISVEDEIRRLGNFLCAKEESDTDRENRNIIKYEDGNGKKKEIEISWGDIPRPPKIEIKPKAKITFSLPHKKIEVTQGLVLTEITRLLLHSDVLKDSNQNLLVKRNNFKISIRAASYYILKILSDELPIDRPDGIRFINKELKLYLHILELFRFRIGIDMTSQKNYIVIRRLFKDFEGFDTHIPHLNLAIY